MYIQTKAYKFNATKKEVQDRMARLGEDSKLKGYWIDDEGQKKYPTKKKLRSASKKKMKKNDKKAIVDDSSEE